MFDTKVKRINVKTSHPNKDKKNYKDEESRSFEATHVSCVCDIQSSKS